MKKRDLKIEILICNCITGIKYLLWDVTVPNHLWPINFTINNSLIVVQSTSMIGQYVDCIQYLIKISLESCGFVVSPLWSVSDQNSVVRICFQTQPTTDFSPLLSSTKNNLKRLRDCRDLVRRSAGVSLLCCFPPPPGVSQLQTQWLRDSSEVNCLVDSCQDRAAPGEVRVRVWCLSLGCWMWSREWAVGNDHTIGWQQLNLLGQPKATLAPQASQAGAGRENLNYETLAPPQARQARTSGEILNYLLIR